MQDEIFHVPQAQLYCAGRWREWHPKITTFPGLYFLGAVAGQLARGLPPLPPLPLPPPAGSPPSSGSDPAAAAGGVPAAAEAPGACSTALLRGVNLLFAGACVPLFYHLARRLDPGRSRQQLLLLVGRPGQGHGANVCLGVGG